MWISKPSKILSPIQVKSKVFEIQNSKQVPTDMSISRQREVFSQMLSECLQVFTSAKSKEPETKGKVTRKKLVPVPDYFKASSKAMYSGGMTGPMCVCTDPTTRNIITTDSEGDNIHVLNANLEKIRVFKSRIGGYKGPCGVVSDGTNIYICDCNNHCVCVTDVHGAVVRQFGSRGSDKGEFKFPFGLALDSRGLLHVCDRSNHRIQVMDKHGVYVREFGQDVFGDEWPWLIAVSSDDKVAVADHSGNIYLFTAGGQHKRTIKRTPPHNIQARGVVFDGHSHLLVSDFAGDRVVVITESGEFVCFFCTQGRLSKPQGLTVTRDGNVVLCDCGNNRLQLFSIPR